MPSIAQAAASSPNTLKRRREDPDISFDLQAKLSRQVGDLDRRCIHPKPRRLHDSKRQRLSLDSTHILEHGSIFTREPLGLSFGNAAQQYSHTTGDYIEPSKPKIDLNPCHICHRKPTIKSELDQYANCEGCGKRTCYICIRECLGSMLASPLLKGNRYDMEGDYDVLTGSFHEEENGYDARMRDRRQHLDGSGFVPESGSNVRTKNSRLGLDSGYEGDDELEGAWGKGAMSEHKRMVCSSCCVEKGTEGEVWCLGCLRAEEEP